MRADVGEGAGRDPPSVGSTRQSVVVGVGEPVLEVRAVDQVQRAVGRPRRSAPACSRAIGWNRYTNGTVPTVPATRCASTSASADAPSSVSGFSQTTCLPCGERGRGERRRGSSLGTHRCTTSTSGSSDQGLGRREGPVGTEPDGGLLAVIGRRRGDPDEAGTGEARGTGVGGPDEPRPDDPRPSSDGIPVGPYGTLFSLSSTYFVLDIQSLRGSMLAVTERTAGQARAASPSAGEVLQHIRAQGSTTRSALVEATGLSRATLGQRLEQLMRHGLVVMEAAPSTGGRPPSRFAFNPRAGVILAADLGATHGTIAVADLAGTRIAVARRSSSRSPTGPSTVLTEVLAHFDELLARDRPRARRRLGDRRRRPGPVDFASGRPVRPPIMPGWDDFDVRGGSPGAPRPRARRQRRERDGARRVLALVARRRRHAPLREGRHRHRRRARRRAVRVPRGARAARATSATCGSTRPAGGLRLRQRELPRGRRLGTRPRPRPPRGRLDTTNTRDVVELAAAGNPDAVRAVRAAGRRLGEALAAAVNMLNPDVIVVGGDLADAHDHLLAGVREVVYQRSTALATQSLRIEESRLGDDAGIEGCIVLALEELLSAEVIDELIDGRGRSSDRLIHVTDVRPRRGATPCPHRSRSSCTRSAPRRRPTSTARSRGWPSSASPRSNRSSAPARRSRCASSRRTSAPSTSRPTSTSSRSKRALDEHGMVAPSSHVQLPEGEHAQEILDEQERCSAARCSSPRHCSTPSRARSRRSTISTASRHSPSASTAPPSSHAARGIRVGYHNHFWEFATDFDGRSGLEVFYELCEPDVVAEIDVYWAQLGGRDPVDLVRTLGDRVSLLHVKDGDGGLGPRAARSATASSTCPRCSRSATAAELAHRRARRHGRRHRLARTPDQRSVPHAARSLPRARVVTER